jgi:hypothetical protein
MEEKEEEEEEVNLHLRRLCVLRVQKPIRKSLGLLRRPFIPPSEIETATLQI